jgi:hypothetical protein
MTSTRSGRWGFGGDGDARFGHESCKPSCQWAWGDEVDIVEVNDAPRGSSKAAGTWPSPMSCHLCERSKEEDDGSLLSRGVPPIGDTTRR